MTTENDHLCIGHDLCFTMDGGVPVITTREYDNHLSLEDLGGIAEWLAEAWIALAGEEYKPVIISERGYVADAGEIVEAMYDPTDSVYDDGNGLERDCE